jgi:hypothetical protein
MLKPMFSALKVLGCFLFAGLLIAAIAPRAVHAVAAALVQVTNTTANPAVTLDAEKTTRIPYVSSSLGSGPGGTCTPPIGCEFLAFTQVPAGYRLVVERVAGQLAASSPNHLGQFRILAGDIVGLPVEYFTGAFDADGAIIVNAEVTAYVDAGASPALLIAGSGVVTDAIDTMTVIGHLENCSVTGCPSVQH